MHFEIAEIHNGWNLKGTWLEPGGGDVAPYPRSETLFCRDIAIASLVMNVWADKGFDAAVQECAEKHKFFYEEET